MHASTMKIQPEVWVVKSRPCRTHMQHMKSTCGAVGAHNVGETPGRIWRSWESLCLGHLLSKTLHPAQGTHPQLILHPLRRLGNIGKERSQHKPQD